MTFYYIRPGDGWMGWHMDARHVGVCSKGRTVDVESCACY
jgi:hypothetical protein